jgi:hypothetical protein
VNDLEKNVLLRLIAGIGLMFGGFYLGMLFAVWCFNWLLEAFQAIAQDPYVSLVTIDKHPLVLFLGLVFLGLTLLISGIGLILGIKKQSA